MVSFVQQTEGVQPTGIGNQQIVTEDLSYINNIGRAIDTAIQGADIVGTAVGKAKAKDLVTEAQRTVDQDLAESEELAKIQSLGDEASTADIARKTALLEKGVAQGKITRENARLRVADLVTKGIEENPLFASKIRQSATNLLGFNPESEGVRQFFGAFQPAGSAGSGLTAAQKENIAISQALDIPIDLVEKQRANSVLSQLKLDEAKANLERNNIDANDYIAKYTAETTPTVNSILADALATIRQDGSISKEKADSIFLSNKDSFILAGLQDLRSRGKYTLEADANLRQQADAIFDRIQEGLGDLTTDKVTARDLAIKTNLYTLQGMEAFDTMARLRLGVGERMASQAMEMIVSARGDKSRLLALKKSSPLIAKFVDFTQMSDEQFSNAYVNTLGKLTNPNATKNDFTPEEGALVDVYLNEVVKKAAPEDKGSVIDQLRDKGFNAKATSLLADSSPVAAAPKEKQYMKNEWNAIKEGLPSQIAALLADRPDSKLELTPTGIVENAGTRTVKGRDMARSADSDIKDQLDKLNVFFKAFTKGWDKELGVADPRREGLNFVNEINSLVTEIKRQDAEERAAFNPAAGRARAPVTEEAPVLFPTSVIDSRTDEENLQRLEELRNKRGQ